VIIVVENIVRGRLTRHKYGSIIELWTISWPLIIASAAGALMLLSGRAVLSKYSAEAFQSQVSATSWWWPIYFTAINIATISRVMVGRFNGEGRSDRIGPAVWQMLWFSLFSLPLMVALAVWLVPHLLASSLRPMGVPYLRILLIGTPIPVAAFGALASFFSGKGETLYVLTVTMLSNLINLLLTVLLVYGLGPFPELGTVGAAIGTVCSQSIALIFFGCKFFSRKNRKKYNASGWHFDQKLFCEMWKIGFPTAMGCFLTWTLWSVMYQIGAIYAAGDHFVTLLVAHTIFSGTFFLIEGLSQGVAVICANAYGAKDWELMKKNGKSWLYLLTIEVAFASILFVFYPGPVIAAILPAKYSADILPLVRHMLIIMWLMFYTSGCSNCIRSMLTAIGDTKFIFLMNLLFYATCNFLPSYLAFRYLHNVLLAGASWVFYNCILGITCFLRMRSFFRKMSHQKI
jgi:MATE family multidrug resistance protein